MEKKHYFLVAGLIYFGVEGSEQTQSIMLNAIATGSDTNIPARMIGTAQQALQMNLFQKMDDPTGIQVRDVVITNVSHLGFMSVEEFQAVPEGYTLQEVGNNNEQAN